jgi:hypothetical protein
MLQAALAVGEIFIYGARSMGEVYELSKVM